MDVKRLIEKERFLPKNAKGRNWFTLSAGVRGCSPCTEIAASSFALYRFVLSCIVGSAVCFAGSLTWSHEIPLKGKHQCSDGDEISERKYPIF